MTERASVLDELAHASHVLPAQGPIEVFIHHNTLHAYQELPFHTAIAQAERQLGVRGYLPEAEYRTAYAEGRIDREDVEWALDRFLPSPPAGVPVDHRELARALLFSAPPPMTRHALELLKAEGRWASSLDPSVDASVRARLVSQTVQWLDEGLRGGDPLQVFTRRLVGPRVDAVSEGLMKRGFPAAQAHEEAIRRVLQPLEVEPTIKGLKRALRDRPDALSAFALWGACVEMGGGVEVLAPVPFDPIETEATRLANEFLVPLCAAFLDRGVARWRLPHREEGFLSAFLRWCVGHRFEAPWLAPFSARAATLLSERVAATQILDAMPSEGRRQSLEQSLLRLPGWGGMFLRLERFPVAELPNVRLADFVAVRLLIDPLAHSFATHSMKGLEVVRPVVLKESVLGLYAASQRLGLHARALSQVPPAGRAALMQAVGALNQRARTVIWHEAYERHHAVEVVGSVLAYQRHAPRAPPATLQAVFCIDDREEAFRRHFEDVLPSVRTYGVAGFFGIAIEFLPLDDVAPATQAPLGVNPEHTIAEEPHPEDAELAQARKRRLSALARLGIVWRRATRGSASGGLASFVAGPWALFELGARVLAPLSTHETLQAIRRAFVPDVRTVLSKERDEEDTTQTIDGRYVGFTVDEKAARVAATLENIGLVKDFAPLVVIVAHGSSSMNNPHRSAYDCGACGGRNGGPNARLFARMANRPAVREALARRGIFIPTETHFVGAVHDTATETVSFFDEAAIPDSLQTVLEAARSAFAEVSRRSAHERCRKFASAKPVMELDEALHHVKARSLDFSQPRPELGHATNAVAVVGRREITRGLFLDRRAFLVSYDPSVDPTGSILERIIGAAGPVGAGINLEYFFSRVDNERLGAGTKLPHNIVSHLGVMNGAVSDLRTGLPKQMVEIHEPVRLLFLIETETDVLERIVARQPLVRMLALNEWIRVVTLSPSGKGCFRLTPSGFVPWDGPWLSLPKVQRWRDWYEGHAGFRPPASLELAGGRRVA